MLNPISRNRTGALGAALSMAIFWSSGANAHGGIPRADLIVSQRNDPTHILLRSQVWGLYLSRDSGATWSWICAETYGITSTTQNRYTARLMNDGSVVLAGAFKGLARSDADACSWSKDPFFEDPATCSPSASCVVNDVVLSDDGTVMTVLTSTGHGATDAGPSGVTTRLWQSTNAGQSWMPLGNPVPESFSAQNVLLSPSDPNRIYLSGKRVDQESGVLYRSTDGGMTWTAVTAIPITDAGSQTFSSRLAGIRDNGDSTDTVYFWADYLQVPSTVGTQPHDLLFVSSDSGQTWSPLFEGTDDLPGLALTPDGASLFISGPGDGLWKADAVAAPTQGQSAFQQVLEWKTWGLEWTDSGLLVGTNDFAADSELTELSRATLARSATGDAPFDPTFVICEADIPSACGSSTTVGQICPNVRDNNDTGGGYDKDILTSARCIGASPDAGTGSGGSNDGGTTKPKHKDDGGCRVGDHRRNSSSSAVALLAFFALVTGLRRSRRQSVRALGDGQ